jgi:sporulation protein YlmC with PRC-barrel domain
VGTATASRSVEFLMSIIDRPVEDADGEIIGTVEDVLISTNEGEVPYLLVARDEDAAATGDELIPVPWALVDVRVEVDEPVIVLQVNAEALEGAPTVNRDSLAADGADWDAEIRTYWDTIPAAGG